MPHTSVDFDPDFASPSEWAVMYRACGLQVVPARSPDVRHQWKVPLLAKWKEWRRTFVPDAVFGGWYDARRGEYRSHNNMGTICGEVSGCVVMIDLDTYKSNAALNWWLGVLAEHNHGMELETWEQITGGGGRQLFFRYPQGWKAVNASTDLNVDIRGNGGFAVLPPSLHTSGKHYDWVAGRAPYDDIEIAVAPAWLLEEVERLIRDHGGGKSGAGFDSDAAVSPPLGMYDAFGHQTDGREVKMTQLIWAAVVDWRRMRSDLPGDDEQRSRAAEKYLVYQDLVAARIIDPTKTKAELLDMESPPRGPAAFWDRWQHAMGKWDGEVAEDAAKSRPSDEPAASGPPPANPKPCSVPLRSAFPIMETDIPPRDWVVPGLMLKRHLSVLVAPPGSGKSLLTLQLAIAVALGMAWGGWKPRKPEKVLVVNAEDDMDEMRRRLFAAAKEMGVKQADLVDRVFLAEAPESIVIARMDNRTKSVVRTPLVEDLIQTIAENGIGCVIIDPFAETFEGDENSNSEVKWAGILWREVARRTGCSLMLVHHAKKYAGSMAGDADASRGGGALIGTARILSTLFPMTEEEATAFNVPVEERTTYVRFDDAKANQSKVGVAKWFEKKTVSLANGNGFVPGDEVGVLVPWRPPGLLDGVSMYSIGLVLDSIDRGVLDGDGKPTGQKYGPTVSSKDRWAGTAVMRLLGCDEDKAKDIVKTWLKNGVLETIEYDDPVQRKPRMGVLVISANRPDRGAQNV